MNNAALISLLHLSDATLPIGGYAHSSGLETYVQGGTVHNKATAKEFITSMLQHNIQYTDAAFVSLAYDAAFENNIERLLLLDDTCHAVKLPREIREGSKKLGQRLIKIFAPLYKADILHQYKKKVDNKEINGHYCVLFGLLASVLGIDKTSALTGFYYNAATAMVTNSVKLVPLGQQEGQELLFSIQPLLQQLVQASMQPNESMIGKSCAGFDIRCMQHEDLYSRLYMS